MCESGAKSPEAPTEPLTGMCGTMPALSTASKVSMTTGRTPENPRAKLAALVSMTNRTVASLMGSPVPTECDKIRLRCSSSSCSSGMRVLASLPKPVLMP